MLLFYIFISISAITLVFSLFVFIFHNKKLADLEKTNQQLQMQQAEFTDLLLPKLEQVEQTIDLITALQQQIERVQQATKHAEITQQITQLKQQMEQLKKQIQASPQDKLYTRAIKMAELGADIEEICHQCDISRLEAETLLAIRRQKPNK